jgi:hypothetical protein
MWENSTSQSVILFVQSPQQVLKSPPFEKEAKDFLQVRSPAPSWSKRH